MERLTAENYLEGQILLIDKTPEMEFVSSGE
jgi:hypothetical protein